MGKDSNLSDTVNLATSTENVTKPTFHVGSSKNDKQREQGAIDKVDNQGYDQGLKSCLNKWCQDKS